MDSGRLFSINTGKIMTETPVPVIEMRGMTKRFPGVVANDHVDFTLAAGEVHALLGENGAGKTTLMNMLYGLYSADEGEIRVDGRLAKISSPKDSIALGISMVHQQFELVETLTVAENVTLGLRARREPILDLKGTSKEVLELSTRYGLVVEPGELIRQLSVGERQRVEIIKALYRGTEILILDEPTSVLTPQEAEELFSFIRSMAKEGKSVVIITHKLNEVINVSDTVTVLRKGKVVGRVSTASTSAPQLAAMMVGHEVTFPTHAGTAQTSRALLQLDNLQALGDKGSMALRGLSLTVNEGEIVGLAGVAGNGQGELVEVLSGTRRVVGGSMVLRGVDISHESPTGLIRAGMGVIPEDRRGSGLIMEFSIADNLVLEQRNMSPFSRRGLMDQNAIRSHAESLVKEFAIATPDVSLPAYTLSGGNLQRLLLAKILSRRPAVLIASHPTAGLDVAATQFIWEKLRSERERGVGILLISSDLTEISALSDRVACIYDGAIVGTLTAVEADIKKIGLLMGGVKSSPG
jgi:general nucleoside transport system ATP-binding protein